MVVLGSTIVSLLVERRREGFVPASIHDSLLLQINLKEENMSAGAPLPSDLIAESERLLGIGEGNEAEVAARKAVAAARRARGVKPDKDTADALANLGRVLAKRGKDRFAKIAYLAAEEETKGFYGEISMKYSIVAGRTIDACEKAGDYIKAKELCDKLLPIRTAICEAMELQWKACMPNRGRFYAETGNLDMAIGAFYRNIGALKKKHGNNHPSVAFAFLDLARFYAKRMPKQAIDAYLRAQEQIRTVFGELGKITLAVRNELARIYVKQGLEEEAEKIYRELLAALNVSDRFSRDALLATRRLAAFLKQRNRIEEAEPLFHSILELCRHLSGQDSIPAAKAMHGLAVMYRKGEKFDQAKAALKSVMALSRRICGKGSPTFLYALSEMADLCYWNLSSYERFAHIDGVRFGKWATSISRKIFGENCPVTAGLAHKWDSLSYDYDDYANPEIVAEIKLRIERFNGSGQYPYFATGKGNNPVWRDLDDPFAKSDDGDAASKAKEDDDPPPFVYSDENVTEDDKQWGDDENFTFTLEHDWPKVQTDVYTWYNPSPSKYSSIFADIKGYDRALEIAKELDEMDKDLPTPQQQNLYDEKLPPVPGSQADAATKLETATTQGAGSQPQFNPFS